MPLTSIGAGLLPLLFFGYTASFVTRTAGTVWILAGGRTERPSKYRDGHDGHDYQEQQYDYFDAHVWSFPWLLREAYPR